LLSPIVAELGETKTRPTATLFYAGWIAPVFKAKAGRLSSAERPPQAGIFGWIIELANGFYP
jgi:hypothetical protein